MMPTTVLSVALGGAIGAVMRYLVNVTIGGFLATLTVNVVGSFLMGVAFVYLLSTKGVDTWQPFVMTGILGGFTTFSAFSLDVIGMVKADDYLGAGLFVLASVVLSIMACGLGIWIAKGFFA